MHGHWGRPVIWFPSEGGAPWDFEANGMLDAVRPAIDDGRITVFCVPSFDSSSWSASWMPLTDRARNHRRYEDWIIWHVVPFIRDRAAAGTTSPPRDHQWARSTSILFALRHPHVFGRAVAFSGNYDPWCWRAWGPADDETLLHRPCSSSPERTAATWTTCVRGWASPWW